MLSHLKKLANFRNLVIYIVVHGVIMIAVLFSAIRFIMPYVKGNLPQIEKLASESFGVDIRVEAMDTGWRGLEPVLRFEGVTMLNATSHETIAQIHYFDVQLDLFGSLRHWKLVPGRLTLDGVTLAIEHEADGSFRLKHHALVSDRPLAETLGTLLTRFHRLTVKNGDFEVQMNKGNPIYLHLNSMTFAPQKSHYRFESEISGTQIPGKLKIIADVTGKLDALEQSSIDGYIQLTDIHYDDRFFPWKFYTVKPQSGKLNLDGWFKWQEGRWEQLHGKLELTQVMLQNTQREDVVLPLNLHANIAWQQLGGDFWRLSGDKIVLKLGPVGSPEASFMLEGGSFEPWNFRLNTVSVDDVLDILTLSDEIDNQTRAALRHIDPQGELHDIQWIATPTDHGFDDWHLGIKMDNLHWKEYMGIPGADHFSGQLKLSKHHGQFLVDSKHVGVTLPRFFEAPLQFDTVHGTVSWAHDTQWTIQTQDLTLANSDAALSTQFTVLAPNDFNDLIMDVSVSTGEFDQVVGKKYLPTRLLPPQVIHWINQSVERGRITSMKAVVKGPINKFPFQHGEGVFDLRFGLDDLDLHFHPSWPTAKAITGELIIDGQGLHATVEKGKIYDSAISNTKISLPFTKPPEPLVLHLTGLLKGTAKDAENFLRASPLWTKLGTALDFVDVRGLLTLDLETDIPLREAPDKFKITGKVNLKEGSVDIKSWNLAMEAVQGDLTFTQNSIEADHIEGNFLGKPSVLSAHTLVKNAQSEITWNLHTTLDKPLVERFTKSPYLEYFEGTSEVDASFKSYIPKRNDPFALTLSSSLEGISLHLPKPLNKTAEEKLPTALTLTFLKPEVLQASFTYGPLAQGVFLFAKQTTGYDLTQGQLVAGAEKSPLPLPSSGLMITGHTGALNIQDWTALKPPASTGKAPEITINQFKVDDLQYKDWHLTHAAVSAQRSLEHWLIDINSDEMEGTIRYPHQLGASPLIVDLKHCTWPLGKETQSLSMNTLTPKDLFPVDFQCRDFKYKKSQLGHVRVGIIPQADKNTVIFDPISLQSDIDKLTATGSWTTKNGVTISHFKGDATSQNAGKSMKAWGMPTDVKDAKGEGHFDLTWPGSPTELSKKHLAGEFDLRLSNGRFVGVSPGFGRMLGLLSFQGLQRRLRLDFSDVFKKGFAFDTFKSNITIKDGVAFTKNAAMKAPAADMTMSGSTDLVTQTLDFDMLVQAHIDSTVPAAAVAIANPAAGAAVWIFDKVFNPLGSVSRYKYHISGTWEKPEFTDLTKEYRQELDGPAKVEEAK